MTKYHSAESHILTFTFMYQYKLFDILHPHFNSNQCCFICLEEQALFFRVYSCMYHVDSLVLRIQLSRATPHPLLNVLGTPAASIAHTGPELGSHSVICVQIAAYIGERGGAAPTITVPAHHPQV
jgi:hypothetical protein